MGFIKFNLKFQIAILIEKQKWLISIVIEKMIRQMLSDDFFMIHSGPAIRESQSPPLWRLPPTFNDPYHQYAT